MKLPPAIRFLVVFVALYLVLNLIYGLWIESWNPQADPATAWVGKQTAWVLRQVGYSIELSPLDTKPLIAFKTDGDTVINLFEGCNGINVMIVFVSFLIAYGGSGKPLTIFISIGLLAIHVFNICRVALLYWLAETESTWFYYFHKYLFTGFLYAMVFLAWWIWIKRYAR